MTLTIRELTAPDLMPYIVLPEAMVPEVSNVLDANKITYWIGDEAISVDGKPEFTMITLDYGTDPALVQALLDGMP